MKTINDIKSSAGLKKPPGVKQRSIPAHRRSAQTEIYMLRKERQHYLKEMEKLESRIVYVLGQINRVDQELVNMMENWDHERDKILEETQVQPAMTTPRQPEKPKATTKEKQPEAVSWKKRSLRY
jgi:formate dehydrogenase maturation protein FdhE